MNDPLDDRLAALGDGPVPPLAPASDLRARGARRRTRARAALGGGAAVVVLLAGGGAYAALSGPPEQLDTASPTPSPSPTPSDAYPSCPTAPVTEPVVCYGGSYETGVPTPTPRPGKPAVSAPPATAAPSTPDSPMPSPSARPARSLTKGVLTLQDADAAEPGDWTFSGNADEGPVLDPCPGGTRYPRDADRTADASTILTAKREAGGTQVLQQVARYPSSDVAQDAAAGYVRAVRGCPSTTDEGTTTTYEVVRVTTAGPTTTYVRQATTTGDGYLGTAQYYAVQQLGDVVSVLVVGHGEDGDPGVRVAEPFAARAAARLERATTG